MNVLTTSAVLIFAAAFAHAADLTLPQARSKYQAADSALNKAYQAAMAELDKTAAAKLREDERDWIAFRDSMVQGDFNPDNGSPQNQPDYWDEMAEYAQDRAEFLRAYSGKHVPPGIAGEYNDSYGGNLELAESKDGIEFDLSAVRGPGHNQGELTGAIRFRAGKAHFKQTLEESEEGPPCELTFRLVSGHIVEVDQKGQDPGAGMGVYYMSPVTSKCTTAGRFKMYHPGGFV